MLPYPFVMVTAIVAWFSCGMARGVSLLGLAVGVYIFGYLIARRRSSCRSV